MDADLFDELVAELWFGFGDVVVYEEYVGVGEA